MSQIPSSIPTPVWEFPNYQARLSQVRIQLQPRVVEEQNTTETIAVIDDENNRARRRLQDPGLNETTELLAREACINAWASYIEARVNQEVQDVILRYETLQVDVYNATHIVSGGIVTLSYDVGHHCCNTVCDGMSLDLGLPNRSNKSLWIFLGR
jgi:hypothetical protein